MHRVNQFYQLETTLAAGIQRSTQYIPDTKYTAYQTGKSLSSPRSVCGFAKFSDPAGKLSIFVSGAKLFASILDPLAIGNYSQSAIQTATMVEAKFSWPSTEQLKEVILKRQNP